MAKTVYRIYRNGEFMKGQTWGVKDWTIDIMRIEMECEMSELQKAHPDCQYTMDIDTENGTGTIDEYYYDENYEEDCWNFDIVKYEIKEECLKR
jgi:hypothetical protein